MGEEAGHVYTNYMDVGEETSSALGMGSSLSSDEAESYSIMSHGSNY